MTPQRIQRRRTRGWRTPPDTIYVGRPSKWGSPFTLNTPMALAREPAIQHAGQRWEFEGRISADGNRHDFHHPGGAITRVHVRYMTPTETVECYRAFIAGDGRWPLDWKRAPMDVAPLRGKNLACWCPLDEPCHADVLLEVANR